MFMYHPNTVDLGRHGCYASGWLGCYAPSAGEIAAIVTKYCNSGCLWAGGIRLKKNFRYAEWLVLDFDKGMTLVEALQNFKDHIHVIGTTRSHQKPKSSKTKTSPPCDRFRVFLRMSEGLKDYRDFEETNRFYIEKYQSDDQCISAAHAFLPCTTIVSVQYHGQLIEIKRHNPNREKNIERYIRREAKYYNHMVPPYIQSMLDHGITGSRNLTSFKIGSRLSRLGFTIDAVVDLIMCSKIPGCGDDSFGADECRRAVENGFKRKL